MNKEGYKSSSDLPNRIPLRKQVSALIWKNWILKRRHWKITITEYIFPMLYCITFLATTGLLSPKGTKAYDYFRSPDFYDFVFYLGVLTLTYMSLVRFINF
jgi:hypothetical protein